ncbi:MAG: methylmalonyl-CoA mutase family protein [Caldilineaceae bacterium]
MASEELSSHKARWQKETLAPQVQRLGERRAHFTTSSNMLPVETLYTPSTVDEYRDGYAEKLGFPGEYPFTRGVQPNMYRGRLWTMRQYAGFSTAAESNRRYHYLLDRGQTGLSVAFDLPTQIGYDADHELAEGEVGKLASRLVACAIWKRCCPAFRSTR